MRPYLAIIWDSFAEALASRVLWILMIIITFVLLGLAPIGLHEQRTTEFRPRDIIDAQGLISDLRQGFEQGDPSPSHRIWSLIDEDTRAALTDFADENEPSRESRRSAAEKLVEAFNALAGQEDLYQEPDWVDMSLGSEARDMIELGVDTLTGNDLARLNHLLVEKSFPDHFQPSSPRQVTITYCGADISPPLPFSHQKATRFIEKLILPTTISLLVGFFAILVAILVTSPIIPQMFDPGSLSLLLSKPLSRSLMFLAKFTGGCAFIFINVAYLISGLWLIVGVQFGIWNQGLLLCIPIFLFLFAIYYSVSAFAGVVWRNAVVSVVMTVLLWFLCFSVGMTKGVVEQFVVETRKILRIIPTGESLVCLDQRGRTGIWNAETRQWDEIYLQGGAGPMAHVMGPIYDSENDMLMSAQNWRRGFMQSGISLDTGTREDDWVRSDGPSLPAGTFDILPDPNGRLLAVTGAGLERWVGDFDPDQKKLKVFFVEIPQNIGKPFRSAGPREKMTIPMPAAAAIDQATGNVAIFSRGNLMLLTPDGTTYQLKKQVETDAEVSAGAAVAVGSDAILVALSDGRILVYDADNLELLRTEKPEPRSQPRFVRSSPDGRWFSAVFHNGKMHIFDSAETENAGFKLANIRGQGTISAADFADENKLLVADRSTRVTEYSLGSWEQTKAYEPALTALEMVYQYAILPIYWAFPKPSELDNTVMYVLQGEETTDLGIHGGDLNVPRPQLRPWAPVRSSLVFTVIVLGLACFYIERQDF